MYQNNAGTGVIGNNNKDVITIPSNGITTFTAGGDESIRLAHASGITWSLQSRSDSEFRITDNNAGTTRLRVQAGTSGDTLLKENSSYVNVTKGIAKAWGMVRTATDDVTIRHNIDASGTNVGTGLTTITFTTDMENTEYSCVGSTNNGVLCFNSKATGSVRVLSLIHI